MTTPSIAVSGLFVYPIKSLRGVSVPSASLVRGRLRGDRDWLLVGPSGGFMHMRDYPQMARLGVRQTNSGVVVSARDLRDLALTTPMEDSFDESEIVYVKIWRRLAPVRAVCRDADLWFSTALGVRCRLMAFVPATSALNVPASETAAALHDATPFHLTSRESLDDLNRRVHPGKPIPMAAFRANVVVGGAPPYAEDNWRTIRIGDEVHLHWIRPCTRCVATTTDPETGERRGVEPLRTLARYRRDGSHVAFGHYLVAQESTGALSVGDTVQPLG